MLHFRVLPLRAPAISHDTVRCTGVEYVAMRVSGAMPPLGVIMKLKFTIIFIVFLAVGVGYARPEEAQKPLTKDQVMGLAKAGMETSEVVELIHENGIDFALTDDYLQALGKAGAQEAVVQALRAARPKSLTQDQVMELVAGHVPSQRAAMLVKQHGIDFLPDEEYLRTLRLAGADDTLIAVLRTAGEAATAQLDVETSPNAEVYLDGESQGHADAQGELAVKARPGARALEVSPEGKKDLEQSVTLAAEQATRIEARLEGVAPSPGAPRENPKDGLKYVWIPPGTFMMGCSPEDSACSDDERPSHQVMITQGFWMGQTPVTVGAYKHFAGAARRHMPDAPRFNSGWASKNMPIVEVTWDDATAFCGWAGGRLPTEAEWEYAARGGSTEVRYGPIDEVAWYSDNSGGKTREVAQMRANGFGLFDILGNVWEWVNDWYGGNYYAASQERDARGPDSGQYRVLRGGSWYLDPWRVRVSVRYFVNPASGGNDSGFRCVREVDIP
ncbi:MAG: SUMF1/EgtB/PvdO family nonheme iron enzyme [Terriglobia bacterium]